ncbi:hypothetical protein [uncultured Brachyspira sp.]|uniref:hypothetical protein n=1 Tax=uncultured Brachyspira sp. TaxID=221953 RepID=UPI0026278E43|nr:hypothetical protein [uncultured Brachyspira sp.]
MTKKILSIAAAVILVSFLMIGCGNKTTDPAKVSPNKGIETYQGNWKPKDTSKPYGGTFTINSDGSINMHDSEGTTIQKNQITDKGNEVYEFSIQGYTITLTFKDVSNCIMNQGGMDIEMIKVN